MTLQTNDVHVNPADEAIRLGPLTVRFLITAEELEWQHRGLRAHGPGGAAPGRASGPTASG